MRSPKLNWSSYSVPQQLVKADFIVLQMTTNVATFANPIPALADISTAITALRTATTAAEGGGFANTLTKKKTETVLTQLMSELTGYVKAVSKGDAATIVSAGFEVRKEPAPTPDPIQVEGVSGKATQKKGGIALDWETAEYTTGYQVEQLMEPESPDDKPFWAKIVVSTKSKYVVENLESGKVYNFRIAALGTGDRIGPFSQEVSSMAL